VEVCVTSAMKGGTGKTTFAEVLAYVWQAVFGLSVAVVKPWGKRDGAEVNIVDFPAFQLSDKYYLKRLLKCAHVVYVVDEDFETLHAVETLHIALRGNDVRGVVLNKVIRRPAFIRVYRRLGEVYVVRFDERMAIHRSVGIPPYKVRSVATLDMAKAAVELKKHIF
jgi:hypothetical protein